ncbi:MAG TPA: phosphatase PAP2 family protein [Xanthobacteraceae bacterium]|nr:phosphatase PAP2 family protein [Xanthobacteraceae bacterium]
MTSRTATIHAEKGEGAGPRTTAVHPAEGLGRTFAANLVQWLGALLWSIRRGRARRPAGPRPAVLLLWSALVAAVVGAAMWRLDPWAVTLGATLPPVFRTAGALVSDFGKGDWVMVPFAMGLAVIAAVASRRLGQMTYGVLLALAARCGFVVLAIAIPGLTATVIKRLIGRARPGQLVDATHQFVPFSWNPALASFPSGHTTTAFAAAVALATLFPRARVAFFAYAAVMALSRVVVEAHHPSDVIAGAAVGIAGALLVRQWFASRGLGFCVSPDGQVKAAPEPSRARLKRTMRAALSIR